MAAAGASKSDPLGGKVFSEVTSHKAFTQALICAELISSDCCKAEGFIARGHAPVLELCRRLVAAGFGPGSRLEASRGNTLCLFVRSIGEGARLTGADDRHGTPRLRRSQEHPLGYVAASPIAPNAGPAQLAKREASP
jgi:hypothetical protein